MGSALGEVAGARVAGLAVQRQPGRAARWWSTIAGARRSRHRHGGYYTTEYGAGLPGATHAWEENRGIGHSYGYNRNEDLADYATGRELLLTLIDTVSRGGNLLLNVGPTADGRIPVVMQDRLAYLGQWLEHNGEAIYGTRTFRDGAQWTAGRKQEVDTSTNYRAKYDVESAHAASRRRVTRARRSCSRARADAVRHPAALSGRRLSRCAMFGSARARALACWAHVTPTSPGGRHPGDVVITVPVIEDGELPFAGPRVLRIDGAVAALRIAIYPASRSFPAASRCPACC